MNKGARKLIILQGNPKIGKTKTLLEVIDQLKTVNGFSAANPQKSERDQRALLINYEGFSVAICTAGDSLSIIEQNYRFFLDNECDVLISSCRINVATHLVDSRTNLMKTSLIGFASGYWRSSQVHFNDDSDHVTILTLESEDDIPTMVNEILKETLRWMP